MCPLSSVRAGTVVCIKQLAASADVKDRLREMGFCEEQQIKLLSREGNIICLVCNSRLGISAEAGRDHHGITVARPVKGGLTMAAATQPLTSVSLGATATVAEIKVAPANRPRLMEMGLLVGTQVELVRFAPMGDPVEIKIRGYNLTLRRQEAEQIWVRTPDAKSPLRKPNRAR